MALLIKTNDTIEDATPKNGMYFTLEELQKFVGGHTEVITTPSFLFVVNDEGKSNNLPFNDIATYLLQKLGVRDVLVGDVLFCRNIEIG